MLLILVIVFLFIIIFFNSRNFLKFNKNQKVLKSKKTTFNKKNLNNWMNLTKKERYNLSKQDSFKYKHKRKLLLEEIRKEYKKISRVNSEKKIKEK